MNPLVPIGIAAGATSIGLMFLRLFFLLAFAAAIMIGSFFASFAAAFPGFAATFVTFFLAWFGASDSFGILAALPEKLNYFIYVPFLALAFIAVFSGLQTAHTGERFLAPRQGDEMFSINGAWPGGDISPRVKTFALSLLAGLAMAWLFPPSAARDLFVVSGIPAALAAAGEWLYEDAGLHNLNAWDGCANWGFGSPNCGFWGGIAAFPNGPLWLLGYMIVIFAPGVIARLVSLPWGGRGAAHLRLALPGLALFVLTATYVLNLDFWLTYVAWVAYGVWLGRWVWRVTLPRPDLKRKLRLLRMRSVLAIGLGLLALSDIDWAMKQRWETGLLGWSDFSRRYEVSQGNPALAWGGVPRLLLGVSPTDILLDIVVRPFAGAR